jgi:hypothetical protein
MAYHINYHLFLDDNRLPGNSYREDNQTIVIARTADKAKEIMHILGCPQTVSFDHDLGKQGAESGHDLAKWMVNRDMDSGRRFFPEGFSFYVHSQNPTGAENIRQLLTNYLKQYPR